MHVIARIALRLGRLRRRPSRIKKPASPIPEYSISTPMQSPRRLNTRSAATCVLCPPLAVYHLHQAEGSYLWVAIALTILGWLPGIYCRSPLTWKLSACILLIVCGADAVTLESRTTFYNCGIQERSSSRRQCRPSEQYRPVFESFHSKTDV